jgi:hypothetical protein
MRDRVAWAVFATSIAGCSGKNIDVLMPKSDAQQTDTQIDTQIDGCRQLDQNCDSTACCSPYVCANIGGANICAESIQPHRRMFVTSGTYLGEIGGLAGGIVAGDTACQSSATLAGLGGTWKAWLSDATTDAIGRLVDVGPWDMLDGTTVFANLSGLAGVPLAPITLDEHGGPFGVNGFLYVWTGTQHGGTRGASHCKSWSTTAPEVGVAGIGGVQSPEWTDNGSAQPCEAQNHLYCFEQ